jgi:hypothetical protein
MGWATVQVWRVIIAVARSLPNGFFAACAAQTIPCSRIKCSGHVRRRTAAKCLIGERIVIDYAENTWGHD